MTDSYIALDLETTGLNPKSDKIIEIGMVKVLEGRVTDTYSRLLNPGRCLEERIVGITGITDEMLSDTLPVAEFLEEIMDFATDLPILGHQIIFDYSFLKKAAVNKGLSFEREGLDTLFLCRLFMPAQQKKNLAHACEYFHIKMEGAHRALWDAMASHLLYQTLKSSFGEVQPEAFDTKSLIYKVKKEQPATKRQKQHLRDLIKYHKICLTVQIDSLSRNEVSRMTDTIISQYGRMIRGERDV